MKKAQEITDRTFDDLLNVIHPGMTEKELCAELIYRLYKYGSEGPSFDPITVSGPNTSLPHGVPSEQRYCSTAISSPWTSAACTMATAPI